MKGLQWEARVYVARGPHLEATNHISVRNGRVYWRVEGSLLELTTVRPIGFFTWNAQTFTERWMRRGLVLMMALLRPFVYAINRSFATRIVHTVLRGVSQDRLDLLGAEYFEYRLKPHLNFSGVQKLKEAIRDNDEIVLVSQGLDHVMKPLALHLGVKRIISNRLEFRDGIATGRLLDPVIRPRGLFARIKATDADGRRGARPLVSDLSLASVETLESAVVPSQRPPIRLERPIVYFDGIDQRQPLSVRNVLRNKHVMLIGVTGFIGKVWLANTLMDLPEIGKIYLLVRRQKSTPAQFRFEKLLEDSPVFEPLSQRYGKDFGRFIHQRVQVIEGDVSQSDLGIAPDTSPRLLRDLDLIVNSSGLTDFNPDLRDALGTNVDAALNVVDFVRKSDHAGLLHLSTCYVAGTRDGRVAEKLRPDYTPVNQPSFDAETELRSLRELVDQAHAKAMSAEVTGELRSQALRKEHAAKDLHGSALENQIRKNRVRWLRNYLTEAGTRRANQLGWPNTYTFTKSLAESLIFKFGADLPIALVRPAIVETSISKPFVGWNEGINTSASLSYLLGTYFRQLPTNERKRLDIIPVDSVCQGMTLIAAAIIERRQDMVYQLATSVTNPCDMRRSIELTSLAHRKHYRAQEGLEFWLRLKFDAIPVSQERYERMSAPAQKAIIKSIQRIMSPLPLRKTPLAKAERSLERVEKLIELFKPFILYNEQDFVADNVEKLSHALVAEEKDAFRYETCSLDWWDYWINIHIPALRKWTYPLIEGRPIETRPSRKIQFEGVQAETVPPEPAPMKTGTDGTSWRYT